MMSQIVSMTLYMHALITSVINEEIEISSAPIDSSVQENIIVPFVQHNGKTLHNCCRF